MAVAQFGSAFSLNGTRRRLTCCLNITVCPWQFIGDIEFGSAPASTIAGLMSHYRAYFIGDDGHFIEATDIIAADDPAAIIAARSLMGIHAIELWEHDRRIVKFDVFKTTETIPGLEHQEAS